MRMTAGDPILEKAAAMIASIVALTIVLDRDSITLAT
jgi:hypothetical protein